MYIIQTRQFKTIYNINDKNRIFYLEILWTVNDIKCFLQNMAYALLKKTFKVTLTL